ncbi:hypothetical protein JTE90_003916 [Oedothorax gibbosus]|uniref:Uncharacterized protein n=1 Tax=Oedothorax gibbosus TaxID=931172 RepID=A0AAV6TLQ0_9ARAC|nr:hypothetical protein JTE90_003916 [Oedothorax gibbosus]
MMRRTTNVRVTPYTIPKGNGVVEECQCKKMSYDVIKWPDGTLKPVAYVKPIMMSSVASHSHQVTLDDAPWIREEEPPVEPPRRERAAHDFDNPNMVPSR